MSSHFASRIEPLYWNRCEVTKEWAFTFDGSFVTDNLASAAVPCMLN